MLLVQLAPGTRAQANDKTDQQEHRLLWPRSLRVRQYASTMAVNEGVQSLAEQIIRPKQKHRHRGQHPNSHRIVRLGIDPSGTARACRWWLHEGIHIFGGL